MHLNTLTIICKHVAQLTVTSVKRVACRPAICDRLQFHTEQARVNGTTPVARCAIVATYSCNTRRIVFARGAIRKKQKEKRKVRNKRVTR